MHSYEINTFGFVTVHFPNLRYAEIDYVQEISRCCENIRTDEQ